MAQRLAALLALVMLVTACGSSQTSPSPVSTSAAATTAVVVAPSSQSSGPSATPSASPTASPSPEPTPTITPVLTPAPTPTPWKTYASKRYHYRIKYPPGWVVTPGTTKLPDSFDDFVDYVYVTRTTISGTVSLSLTVSYETNYVKSHYRGKLLSSASASVAGWAGRLLTFNVVRDGRKLYFQELILAKASVAYFLAWWSDRGTASHDRRVFKSIYRTFRPT